MVTTASATGVFFPIMKTKTVSWENAHQFIERQTVALEKEFHRSKPEPRNRKMGFREEESNHRRRWRTVTSDQYESVKNLPL